MRYRAVSHAKCGGCTCGCALCVLFSFVFLAFLPCFLLVFVASWYEAVEVALEDEAYALCSERGLGEVSVVGLVVALETETAREEVTDVEVTDKVGGVHGVVAVSEAAVDEQAVVEQATFEDAFYLHVVPVLAAEVAFARHHVLGTQVAGEVPVVVADDACQEVVDLPRDGGADERLYVARGPLGILCHVGGVELA